MEPEETDASEVRGQAGDRDQPDRVSRKSRQTAGLLGLIGGGLGLHNFYLGRMSRGACQVLLSAVCWFLAVRFNLVFSPFIAYFWGMIEGVLILASHNGSPWHRDARGLELLDS